MGFRDKDKRPMGGDGNPQANVKLYNTIFRNQETLEAEREGSMQCHVGYMDDLLPHEAAVVNRVPRKEKFDCGFILSPVKLDEEGNPVLVKDGDRTVPEYDRSIRVVLVPMVSGTLKDSSTASFNGQLWDMWFSVLPTLSSSPKVAYNITLTKRDRQQQGDESRPAGAQPGKGTADMVVGDDQESSLAAPGITPPPGRKAA